MTPDDVQAALKTENYIRCCESKGIPVAPTHGLLALTILARFIREQAAKTCAWSQEEEESEVYSAACHPAWLFEFTTDAHDEHWTHCPYCGLALVWAKAEPWKDEDEEREG